jgi:hypothetical protein
MATLTLVNQIEASIAKFLPSTLTAVLATEGAAHNVAGATKLQNVVNAVIAGTAVVEAESPAPSVAAIAGLANLLVTILNYTGVFKHGAPPAVPVMPIPPVTLAPVPVV